MPAGREPMGKGHQAQSLLAPYGRVFDVEVQRASEVARADTAG